MCFVKHFLNKIYNGDTPGEKTADKRENTTLSPFQIRSHWPIALVSSELAAGIAGAVSLELGRQLSH